MARLYQGAFNSGELAPGLWGRVDLDRFQSGLRVARNMLPRPEGGIHKRPGFQFTGYDLESLTADLKLIPFKFNNDQTYVVCANPNSLYFVRDGGVIIEDMPSGTPTVDDDATGVYVDHTSHGFSGGEKIFWIAGGYNEIEGRWCTVQYSTANRFYLLDYVSGLNIQGDSYTTNVTTIDYGEIYSLGNADGWFTDHAGATPDLPVGEIDYTQANDTLYVSHPSGPSKVITRTGDTAWTIANFNPAPDVTTPSWSSYNAPSNQPTSITSFGSETYVDHATGAYSIGDRFLIESGFHPDWVGKWVQVGGVLASQGGVAADPTATRHYLVDPRTNTPLDSSALGALTTPVYSQPATFPSVGSPPITLQYAVTAIDKETFEESLAVTMTIYRSDNPTAGDEVELFWDDQADAKTYRIYKAIGGIYGLIGTAEDIDPDNTGDQMTFMDAGVTPNLSIAPPLEADFFNDEDEYPGAVELFQQRILFGRSNNLLRDIYMSRAGSLKSFATSTVSVPDDPIEQAIAAKSVQEVKHFVPLRDLVILTTDGEWGFDTGDEGALSPDSGLIAQSFWGTAGVKPVLVGESAIFVERAGKSIRDLAYALQNDGFASSDISIFAKHLFRGRSVVSMCFAQTPFRTLFCVMSDGQAVSCTYVRDQQIFAWARHDTRGRMLDCVSIEEDGKDNIYVVVERATELNTRYRQIERMEMIDPQYVEQGVWLDNSMEANKATSTVNDGVIGNAVVQENVSNIDELYMTLPDTGSGGPVDNTLVRITADEESPLSQLDGVVFQVVDFGVPTGGIQYRQLYRSLNGSTTDRDLFDPDGVYPSDWFVNAAALAYFVEEVDTVYKAHHLVSRDSQVSIRADYEMYDGLTIPDGGVYQFGASQAAACVQIGESYVAEIETLDIDFPQNPITGLPVSISTILVRFTMCVGYSIGRRRNERVSVSLSELYADEDWDSNLGYFQGIMDSMIFPGWRKDGRMVIRSVDGFPFQISALVPQIEAGGFDVDQ